MAGSSAAYKDRVDFRTIWQTVHLLRQRLEIGIHEMVVADGDGKIAIAAVMSRKKGCGCTPRRGQIQGGSETLVELHGVSPRRMSVENSPKPLLQVPLPIAIAGQFPARALAQLSTLGHATIEHIQV